MITKIKVAQLQEIDGQGARTLAVGDKEIAVFRLSDGSVRAIENRCPHKGGGFRRGWCAVLRFTALFTIGKSICTRAEFKSRIMEW